jgi:hypothetical protein
VIGPEKSGKILAGREHRGIVRGNKMRVNNQFSCEKVYNQHRHPAKALLPGHIFSLQRGFKVEKGRFDD